MLFRLRELLFPIICVWCEREWKYLCDQCKTTIRPHPELCPSCHIYSPLWVICYSCKYKFKWVDSILVAFVYEKLIKKLIIDLKFKHRYDTGTYLWEKLWLLLLCNPLIDPKTTLITHVPSHRRRKNIQKGYNQSEILAKTVSKYTGIKHYTLFKKVKHTKSQTTLNKIQRKTSLRNAFEYISTQEIPNGSKTIIIVDDIVTTGSTLNILGTLFKLHHPTSSVRWLVVGRHMW